MGVDQKSMRPQSRVMQRVVRIQKARLVFGLGREAFVKAKYVSRRARVPPTRILFSFFFLFLSFSLILVLLVSQD